MEIRSGSDIRYQTTTIGLLALVAAAMTLGLSAQPSMESDNVERLTIQRSDSSRTPQAIIREWPEDARNTARVMIEKYGQPNRLSSEALIWYNNGPWQKTIVYRRAWPHSLAMIDEDYLEQTINYLVPDDKINDLKRFDPRISVNKASWEISSRSDSESTNFLVLNLADEIVTDKRSIEDARIFYRRTQRLSESGKDSPYMKRFMFELLNDGRSAPEYP